MKSNWDNTICSGKCSKKQYDGNKDGRSLLIICSGYSIILKKWGQRMRCNVVNLIEKIDRDYILSLLVRLTVAGLIYTKVTTMEDYSKYWQDYIKIIIIIITIRWRFFIIKSITIKICLHCSFYHKDNDDKIHDYIPNLILMMMIKVLNWLYSLYYVSWL